MTVTINGTTGVSGVAGSASTPALIGSDADSGYYINSANEPNASVNGTAVWNAASTFGFKNRIINGAMMIDQRNAGAAVTTNGAFPTDRFYVEYSMDGAYSAQRDTSAPAGFINSLKFTTTTADSSLAAGQYIMLGQKIEGLNVADLAWGTASASSVTLSFWVRSSLTGTFSGSLRNSSGTRSYPFTYTISAADTWEQKTVTIAGDQSGTWLTTNGIGIDVDFSLGCGTTFSGTANAWVGSNKVAVTGAVSVIGTLNATFYITGVQLEKGSTTTSFDYRPYGTELQLCQRYYQLFGRTNGSLCAGTFFARTSFLGYSYGTVPLIQPMRTTSPSFSWGGGLILLRFNGAGYTTAAVTSAQLDAAGDKSGNCRFDIAGSWTANDAMVLSCDTTGYISFSTEL